MSYSYMVRCLIVLKFFGGAVPGYSQKPKIWNVPADTSFFVGRSEELRALKAAVHEGPVVITGISGIGKTSLAYQFARHEYQAYDLVWSFDVSKSMELQMIDFANKVREVFCPEKKLSFKKADQYLEFVKNTLRVVATSWLLIFDNADSFAEVSPFFPESHGQKDKHVIVTSLSTKPLKKRIQLEELSLEESVTLLKKYLGNKHEDKNLLLLAKILENHPLALRQAASYILSTPGMSISAYIDFFVNKKHLFWRAEEATISKEKTFSQHPLLYTSIKISLEKIKKEHPKEHILLCFLSMLNPSDIENFLIKKWLTLHSQENLARFGVLLEKALITEASSDKGDFFRIHTYVKNVIHHDASAKQMAEAAQKGALVLKEILSESSEDSVAFFEKNPNFLTHLKSFLTYKNHMTSDDFVEISNKVLYYSYYFIRNYDYSRDLSNLITKEIESNNIKNPLLMGTFYSIKSSLFGSDLDQSIVDAQTAYQYLKKSPHPKAKKELVLLIANNLGYNYYWQGRLDDVEKCIHESESLLGDDDDAVGLSVLLSLKILLALDRGSFSSSQTEIDKLLALCQKNEFVNKYLGHYAKALWAKKLLKQSHFKKAQEVALSAYQHAIKSSQGEEEEVVARTLLYLSQAECGLGHYKKSEKMSQRAVNIFDSELGGSHQNRRQALAHMSLGDAYFFQGRYPEALAEYRYSENIYGTICKEFSFDDISELYFKFIKIGIALKDPITVKEYSLKHQKRFPVSHKRFVQIVSMIDSESFQK